MKKNLVLFLITAFAVLSGLVGTGVTKAAELRYCNTSPIIQCGTLTTSEFTQKYTENKTNDLPAIFAHYSIDPSAISSAKEGTINENGEVKVNGKVVANGAWSVGREKLGTTNRAVSINTKTYYEKPAAAALTVAEEPAFVFLDQNGKYTGAIIKSCGNPIKATAVPVETPKEEPKPVPAADCKALTATITDRTKYRLDAQATVSNGATISSYYYTITNTETDSVVRSRTVTSTETRSSIDGTLPAGDYEAKVVIKTSVGDKTGAVCTEKFTIEKESCPIPGKETLPVDSPECKEDEEEEPVAVPTPITPSTPTALPQTGPAEQLLGILGIGSVIASGSYYYASRRGIISAWMNK